MSDAMREALDLMAGKLLEDDAMLGADFPYVTTPTGAWATLPALTSAGYGASGWSHGNWFCGFWVGLLVLAHLHTGDGGFLDRARRRMAQVAPRATDGGTHDIGFIFYPSAALLHHVTGEQDFAATATQAAAQLRRRLIHTPRGSYISSWGPLDDLRGRRSSAIDTMANLRLLYWAAAQTQDASFILAGEAHARMTALSFIRPDRSTYHAVEYDLPSGRRQRGYTFQGWSDESCWPRGQAWAILGYVETARATRDPSHLLLAEELARYYLHRLGDNLVPPWDFDDPALPDAPRDSSAAAIIAGALLGLADLHPDAAAGEWWRAQALAMLAELCQSYIAQDSAHRGLLMHGCYSIPHNEGVDSAVLFGDYFFAEALMQVLRPGAARSCAERLVIARE